MNSENFILSWQNCEDIEMVGTKAHNLWRLANAGLRIPRWLSLTTRMLEFFLLHDADLKKKIEKLESKTTGKINLLSAAEDVLYAMASTPIPNSSLDQVMKMLEEHEVCFPVAVRSSGVFEDILDNAFAGIYETSLNVTQETLADAIRNCWISLYSQRAILQLFESRTFHDKQALRIWKRGMGVIIQNMVLGDAYGVAFTADPISGNSSFITIEAASSAAAVVSGMGDSLTRFLVEKQSGKILNQRNSSQQVVCISNDQVLSIAQLSLHAEETFSLPQDVEWVVEGDNIYLLQSRPVGRLITRMPPLPATIIISTEDEEHSSKTDLEITSDLELKYSKKKFALRRYASAVGIRLSSWYWCEWDAESLVQLGSSYFENLFRGNIILIDINLNLRGLTVSKHGLFQFLLDLVNSHPSGRMKVLLRDLIQNDVSAVSTLMKDGNVLIEFAKGAVRGILSGIAETSSITINEQNQIVGSTLVRQTNALVFDQKKLELVEVKVKPSETYLNHAALADINSWTRILDKKFPGGYPEWWIDAKDVYLADISISSGYHELNLDETFMLSPGIGKGYVFVLRNTDMLAEYADQNNISVNDIKSATPTSIVHSLQEQIRIFSKGLPIILIAPRPHVGLIPLLNLPVVGCVFTEGGLLCHLAVTLRERKIPAVADNNAMKNYKTGDYITISNGMIYPYE
jgi:phosphoenolpyruvate synthase/pyruvate phosphate dikinase